MDLRKLLCLPWLMLCTHAHGQRAPAGVQAGGLVTNQAITPAGQDFFQTFTALWQALWQALWKDNPLHDRYTIAIRERPSAKNGNAIQVDYGNRTLFRAVLPAGRDGAGRGSSAPTRSSLHTTTSPWKRPNACSLATATWPPKNSSCARGTAMTTLGNTIVLGLFLAGRPACTAQATVLVYVPVNPTFGGSPLTGTTLLATAEATNRHKDAAIARSALDQTPLEQFNDMLQRSVLAQLSTAAVGGVMGNGGRKVRFPRP